MLSITSEVATIHKEIESLKSITSVKYLMFFIFFEMITENHKFNLFFFNLCTKMKNKTNLF